MAAADRLSSLTDDLLVSILSFLPTRDAARTADLSRQWRPLWLTTDTLNLDSRSYGDMGNPDYSGLRVRLFSKSGDALSATGRCPVRKLSLFVKGPNARWCKDVMGTPREVMSMSKDYSYEQIVALLAALALRHIIKELRIGFQLNTEGYLSSVYKLDPALLPGDTLRVLDLACCNLDSSLSGSAASFPQLSSLRLYKCSLSKKGLEDLIRAMPNLESLHIESLCYHFCVPYRLVVHSASLTTLTLVDRLGSLHGIELDTPCLHVLKYNRPLMEFLMRSQATKLARVDLTLEWMYQEYGEGKLTYVAARFAPLCQFLGNFQHAKAIRLKVLNIGCITVNSKKDMRPEHLVMLPALERLELQGSYGKRRTKDVAAIIADLPQCCPAIHDLRIKINIHRLYQRHRFANTIGRKVLLADLFKSAGNSKGMAPLRLDYHDGVSKLAELPGVTGCRFGCLQNCVNNVKVQFELLGLDSIEVCRANFLLKNCMVLRVLQIDDQNLKLLRHVNSIVEIWRANTMKRSKQMEQDSTEESNQMGKRKRDHDLQSKVKNQY